MRKLFIMAAFCAAALNSFGQGTLEFIDYSTYGSGAFEIHIYSPNPADPYTQQIGAGPGDKPTAGTTPYGGMKVGGGNTMTTGGFAYNYGGNFTVQLYAAGGNNQPASALMPITQYTSTIDTATSALVAGIFVAVNPNLNGNQDPGIPNSLFPLNAGFGNYTGSASTVELAVFYNQPYNGNTATTLASAIADGVPYGTSQIVNDDNLGGSGPTPGTPTTLGPTGITSFSLVLPTVIPEPGTFALGILGASTFLLRRRAK